MRKYGNAPYNIAVIHGGPGAPGEMAPVARELSTNWGILEPFQTAASIEGQLHELQTILKKHVNLPVILIGHSWGAWLSFIFSAKYSSFVEKLILIGSGPYEEKYVPEIMKTRLSRLTKKEIEELQILTKSFNDPAIKNKDTLFARFGKLFNKSDTYDPLAYKNEVIDFQFDIFQSVWKEAAKLRRSGELLKLGKQIQCPVTAIHGDYDPHPYKGVEIPLSRTLKNFNFILLKDCGHDPWIEHYAKEKFYNILKEELT